MSSRQLELGGIRLTVPENWHDMTGEQQAPDAPFTLADSDEGAGALQLSVALHQGGPEPRPSEQELLRMAREVGQQHSLGASHAEETFSEGLFRGAGVSFHSGEDFIRIWYVSDGRNFSRVTYVCEWSQQERELPICESIVRSIRFLPG